MSIPISEDIPNAWILLKVFSRLPTPMIDIAVVMTIKITKSIIGDLFFILLSNLYICFDIYKYIED